MNNIEKHAKETGYLDKYLDTYIPLYKLRYNKFEEAKKQDRKKEANYWSCFDKFQYMTFESIHYLYFRYVDEANLINSHLPSFMSTYLMEYPIAEYLRNMMCFREISINNFKNFEKNEFTELLKKKTDVRKKKAKNFLKRVEDDNIFRDIIHKWEGFDKKNEFRHTFTHMYRLLWVRKEENGPYGFPKSIFQDKDKIKDEVWNSISNENYEQDVIMKLSNDEFVSGCECIKELHQYVSEIANLVFKALLKDIEK